MERDISFEIEENYYRKDELKEDVSSLSKCNNYKPQKEMKSVKSRYIVGIGASTEGFDALEQFFSAVPSTCGMSFVVIQHLSPNYKNFMAELLARRTNMRVYQAADAMRIEPNCIYVIPPMSSMTISHGQIHIKNQSADHRQGQIIDTFFSSLAKEQGEKAVGVILSGIGTDGIRGCAAIKEAGGIIMVQDEYTAKFSGMPRNIISVGICDYILPPDKMPFILLNRISQLPVTSFAIEEEQILGTYNNQLVDNSLDSIISRLVEEYLPPSIIIDYSGKLIQTIGSANDYLRIPRGKVSFNILDMVPQSASLVLKHAIEKVNMECTSIPCLNVVLDPMGNKKVNMLLRPVNTAVDGSLIMIVFEEKSREHESFKPSEISSVSAQINTVIGDYPLSCIQKEIEDAIDEAALTSKMSVFNEKVYIPNDKSTGNAFERSSDNDNVYLTNSLYESKIQTLVDLNNDINNFLNSTSLGTIFLDRELAIRKFTPMVTKEINLMDHDIGRPISHISHNFRGENLAQNSIRVLNNLVPQENEVQSINGNWYILKYSPCYTMENTVRGIVISLVDISELKKAHDKLHELSYAVDQSSSMIMITNVDGKIEYVNSKFSEVTGYTFEEIIGKDFGILKSGAQDALFYKNLRETIASGKEWKGELSNKKKSGEVYWERASISPVKNKEGIITHFIEIKEDITSQMLMLESLKNSEEKFRQVFDNAKDSIFLYGFNAKGIPSRLIEANKTACEVFGYNKEELYTMSLYDVIDEEYIGNVRKMNQNLLSQGYATYEVYCTCKNGYRIPVEINCHIFSLNGEQVALLIARDITERKRTEDTLLKSKERYEMLVEYSPYSILIVSNGCILFSNVAGLNMLDVPQLNDIAGKPIMNYFNIDIQKLMKEQTIYSEVGGKPVIPLEDKFIRTDGTTIYVEITAMPFFFEGKSTTLLMIRDITSRKQAEDLQKDIERSKKLLDETIEYDTLKTEFFSNLSHELRTPLNVITSTLQILSMHLRESTIIDKDKKIGKYTGIMKQNCYRLLRLVNNMIDVTRIDAGFFDYHLKNCNIVNIVEDITLAVAGFVKKRKLNLVFDTDVEEKMMSCDPEKIERIMLNLLSNAVKFTRTGGNITVNIMDRKESILISVKDTGIGIPEDKLDIIFERFRQVDKSLTRSHEGSGIGLSIVKSLVEMHKGKISVKSEFGKGSEFIIEIPAVVLTDEVELYKQPAEGKKNNEEKVFVEFSDIYNLN